MTDIRVLYISCLIIVLSQINLLSQCTDLDYTSDLLNQIYCSGENYKTPNLICSNNGELAEFEILNSNEYHLYNCSGVRISICNRNGGISNCSNNIVYDSYFFCDGLESVTFICDSPFNKDWIAQVACSDYYPDHAFNDEVQVSLWSDGSTDYFSFGRDGLTDVYDEDGNFITECVTFTTTGARASDCNPVWADWPRLEYIDFTIIKGCVDQVCNISQLCDDMNPCTTGEALNSVCECTGGIFQDSDNDTVCDAEDQCPGFDDRLIGTSCDDQNACTSSTTWQSDCMCAGGIFDDADDDGVCDADDNTNGNCTLSESCDDGDPCTTGETRDSNCECVGGVSNDSDNDTVCDALDQCDGFDDNLIGSPCDDDSDCTSGTTWQSDCACGGGVFDDMDGDSICDADDQCEGFNDLLLGTACDDDNECTIEDIYDPNTCTCIGIEVDSDNDGICDALDICLAGDDRVDVDNDGIPDSCDDCNDDMIGEVCDDGLSETYDDMILYDGANQEICNCQGLPCPENVSLLDTILCDYESLTINGQTLNINNPSFEFGPFPDQLGCDSTFVVNITFEVSGTENCLDLDGVTIDEDVDDMVVTPENSAVFEDITEETHSLLIYNRWGNKVFQVMNPPIGFTWDGTYQRSGNMLPEGTYYFLLFERSEDGEGIKPNAMKSGYITLLN